MAQPQIDPADPADPAPSGPDMSSWDDDDGRVRVDLPPGDLNRLLAIEQTSIMNAESASTPAAFEFYSTASRNTRRLVNATPYPEHEPHVFAQDRTSERARHDNSFRALAAAMERHERLLSRQFAAGQVSAGLLQHRERCLRQDRAHMLSSSGGHHVEEAS